MSEHERRGLTDDAHDLQAVAALLERSGLRLPAGQIAELVAGYRTDRAKMAALWAMLTAEDEPSHTFQASTGRAGA